MPRTFAKPTRTSPSRGLAAVAGTAVLWWMAWVAVSLWGQQPVEFNRDIRPILSENCFFCHGQDAHQRQSGLRLDVREAAVGLGAIVPGDTAASALIDRIESDDPDYMMPPPDSHRQLSETQKAELRAVDPQGAAYQTHWAFVAPRRPDPPPVQRESWVRNPIDRFVLARLEAAGMPPSPPADRATLIKRLSIDLTGLPPAR